MMNTINQKAIEYIKKLINEEKLQLNFFEMSDNEIILKYILGILEDIAADNFSEIEISKKTYQNLVKTLGTDDNEILSKFITGHISTLIDTEEVCND